MRPFFWFLLVVAVGLAVADALIVPVEPVVTGDPPYVGVTPERLMFPGLTDEEIERIMQEAWN